MWTKIKKFISHHRYKIIAVLGLAAFGYFTAKHFLRETDIKFSIFIKALQSNFIEQVIFEGDSVYFRSGGEQWFHAFIGFFPKKVLFSMLDSRGVVYWLRQPTTKTFILTALEVVMPLITLKYMVDEAVRPPSSIQIAPEIYESNSSFQDFYGGEIIKAKLTQIINFLDDPSKFEKLGARIRRGVLLYGPPGTGKTMLARALANQAKCEFIRMAASEFQEIFAGVGPKRVRQLFNAARKCGKGCIIYIDEIDALGSRINSIRDSEQTTKTITQFLSEMDGFSPLDKVVVVASTNRIDLVDPAVLRAGRFDIKVQICLPDQSERLGILKTLMAKKLKRHSVEEQQLQVISEKSEGCCGADFEALINQSIYKAIRERKKSVQSIHMRECLQQMMLRKV